MMIQIQCRMLLLHSILVFAIRTVPLLETMRTLDVTNAPSRVAAYTLATIRELVWTIIQHPPIIWSPHSLTSVFRPLNEKFSERVQSGSIAVILFSQGRRKLLEEGPSLFDGKDEVEQLNDVYIFL